MRPRLRYGAWALILLILGGCQPGSGSLSKGTAAVEVIPSIPGMVSAPVGGSQTVSITFSGSSRQSLKNLVIMGGLALPSGWSGPNSFVCAELSAEESCSLSLTYSPTAVGSGTLALRYTYQDATGGDPQGTLSIPYRASTSNTIVATTTPSGQLNAAVGAGNQNVQVIFSTSDGKPVSNFALTSNLGALPAGWSSSANAVTCATVSTGNGCAVTLSYAPSAPGSGTVALDYSYTDDAGVSERGALNIPYVAATSNSLVGSPSPAGQIAVTTGGSQSVTVTFDTNDGNPASGLAVTTDLSSLPTGWTSSASSFSCATVSTGNGCQLALTYAPTSAGTGSVTIAFTYLNDAGTAKSGSVTLLYTATANDNVIGTPSLSGQIATAFGASQTVGITFTTDDGNSATGLSVTTALSSLAGGWSSGASSFSCATVSTGNGCQLALSYAPTTASSGILTLLYSYINDAGSTRSGSVSLPYTAWGTIGGTVTGLSGALTLEDNGTDLRVLSANGAFTFATRLVSGAPYNVTVAAQPTGQHCTVAAGSGTVTGTVNGVIVSCGTNSFSVGGTISGLAADGLTLTDNGTDALSVIAGTASYAFATPLAYGAGYAAAILTQPTGQACTLAGGSGTVTGAVTSVNISCATNTYPIGGTISGLTAAGLVLTDNGGNALTVPSGSTSFTFSAQLAYGMNYTVAVSTQPTGELCSVASGSGTVSGTINGVSISCSTTSYHVGGTITGLAADGLTLTDNGIDTLSLLAGTESYTFATPLAYGMSYTVAVATQPTGETCTVSGGSGTVTGAVTSANLSCAARTYSIGGTISGLTAAGLVLTDNGGNALSVNSGSTSFTFTTQLPYGSTYTVAVSTQPTGELCTVSMATGNVTATVTTVNVSCVTSYTLGGTLSGLNLSSVVLANGSVSVTVAANTSPWVFATSFAANSSYAVNVQMQPTGAVCQVTSGANGVLTGNVTNVAVACGYGLWTWENGAKIANQSGVYGTQGVAAAGNVPGARAAPVTWTDTSGNFWLLGGSATGSTYLSDLWEYSTTTGQWSWVSGSTGLNSLGVYGTKGVAGASNSPGARWRSSSWTDAAGNFWVFGGIGYGGGAGSSSGNLNDLWKYDPSAGTWTWISGSNATNATGVYGTKGVAAAANTPGARSYGITWVDATGNQWLFGGAGYGASGGSGSLNDLWKFSPTSGEWTWVGGSSAINSTGTYGTQGVAAAGNWPGARGIGNAWIDSSGNFWLFGGSGFGAAGASGTLNDLWEYSPTTGQWTWISGATATAAAGVFGTEGVAAASNVPPARILATSWIDATGRLWLFGGNSAAGFRNDVWYFTPGSGEWTWLSGGQTGNASGVYGTQGTAALTNMPGSRQSPSSWLDSSGNVWMFGGAGYDSVGTSGGLNDLWEFHSAQ